MTGLAAALLIAIVLLVLYWLFIIAEGTYLGCGMVVLLYDWGARSYDRIKNLDPVDEAEYLALPILDRIRDVPYPRVLDVATGTARLPLTLLRQPDFRGYVVGLDLSAKMLEQARRNTARLRGRLDLVRQRADQLPFRDACFDVVTCLEALEFMPDPQRVVAEMVRVLRPGGLLLVSNRVGWEARLLPGRYCTRGQLERLLATQPLMDIQTKLWQTHYDLIWARKEKRGTT